MDKRLKALFTPTMAHSYSHGILGLYDNRLGRSVAALPASRRGRRRPPATVGLAVERGFTWQTLAKFDAGYDSDFQRITIPLFAGAGTSWSA